MKDNERKYATHDLELASIVHAMKIWWHYLVGIIFVFKIDNVSLEHLFDQQNLNARKAQRLAFLREFYFEIKHIKGKENKVVDAISKRKTKHT